MHPLVLVTVNGQPMSGRFYSRLISVSVTDKAGITADTVDIELNDGPPDFLAVPTRGARIEVAMGYRETGSVSLGSFVVDEVALECLPYRMKISGKSADLRREMKENRERHWDDKTLGAVVQEIAGDHGLSARIPGDLAGFKYDWLGQQNESDIHFLERLARRHNALFTVKAGNLLFVKRGAGETASGALLGGIVVTPGMIVDGTCRVKLADRGQYKEVAAYYQDREKAKRVEVTASAGGDGSASYRIGEPFASEDEAEAAAGSKAEELERDTDSTSVTIEGNPSVTAGSPLTYAGVRPEADGRRWIIETARHSYSKGEGYRTAIDAKVTTGNR